MIPAVTVSLHAAVAIALLVAGAASTLTYLIGHKHGATDEANRRRRHLRVVTNATKETSR